MKIAACSLAFEVNVSLCFGACEPRNFGSIRANFSDHFTRTAIYDLSRSLPNPLLRRVAHPFDI